MPSHVQVILLTLATLLALAPEVQAQVYDGQTYGEWQESASDAWSDEDGRTDRCSPYAPSSSDKGWKCWPIQRTRRGVKRYSGKLGWTQCDRKREDCDGFKRERACVPTGKFVWLKYYVDGRTGRNLSYEALNFTCKNGELHGSFTETTVEGEQDSEEEPMTQIHRWITTGRYDRGYRVGLWTVTVKRPEGAVLVDTQCFAKAALKSTDSDGYIQLEEVGRWTTSESSRGLVEPTYKEDWVAARKRAKWLKKFKGKCASWKPAMCTKYAPATDHIGYLICPDSGSVGGQSGSGKIDKNAVDNVRIHGMDNIGLGFRAGLGKEKAKRVGKLKVGSGASTGFCKKSNLRSVVRRRAGAIRACYESRLQVSPKLSGKLTARWTVTANGSVSKVSAGGSMKDGKVKNCVLRVLRRMRFAPPEGGNVCDVEWPFVFSSGGEIQLLLKVRGGRLSGQSGSGKVDTGAVKKVFRRRTGAIKHCYEKELKTNPSLAGEMTIRFQIGTGGHVTRVKVTKNTTGSSSIGSCITAKVKGWRFPSPEGGPVTFSYPFILSKGSGTHDLTLTSKGVKTDP